MADSIVIGAALAHRTIAGVRRIESAYDDHVRAARRLAEDELDARRVPGRLVEELG